jgi:hypothetical protein
MKLNSESVICSILLFACGFFLAGTFLFIIPDSGYGQDISIDAETGGLWFSRNDVRIPNEEGTDFDMLELIGTNAVPYYRFRLNVIYDNRHTVRLLFAPISKIGTGVFDDEVFFEETAFEGGVPIDGTYRFNTYRLTYRYTFYDRRNWTLGAGVAGLIRDAKVELMQPDRSDSNTDLGFVPLIHLYAERGLSDRFSLILDAETLAGPQGRATDASLTLNYALSDRLMMNTGYRVLEGGADVDAVYNFAWINFVRIGLTATF